MILELSYGTFEAPDSDTFLEDARRDGFWGPELQPYLDRVPAKAWAVDVGAHIGLYAGYLASRGVRVLAVEAHPLYLPLLRQNLRQHDWWRLVEVVPWFAYSRVCRLAEQPEHPTRASNTWLPTDDAEGVPAYPLDDFLVGGDVRLLKVDAQGADLQVLLGAERILQARHPAILIEYEAGLVSRHGDSVETYRDWRLAHGYREESINGWNAYWTWEGPPA